MHIRSIFRSVSDAKATEWMIVEQITEQQQLDIQLLGQTHSAQECCHLGLLWIIEFLRNQFLKIDEFLNGINFALIFRN
jgi:hypothetical protein